MRTQNILGELPELIEQGKEGCFYRTYAWEETRKKVLALDRYECQSCKKKGRYAKARMVHHIKHIQDRPDLALSIFDPDTGERQLVSLCTRCHAAEHPERTQNLCPPWKKSEKITKERWD